MTLLSPSQKECVKQFGFGDNFYSNDMVIRTKKGNIKVDAKAVNDVFGIPNGGTDIYSLVNSNTIFIEQWLRQFETPDHIRPSQIAEKITNFVDADDLFKMNFLMLFASTMNSCESNGKVKLDVLNYIPVDADIASLDWCSFLLENLKVSKNYWNREFVGKKFYSGPITFLILLYCDRTRFDAVKVPRERPIRRNWNRFLTMRETKEADSGGFGLLEILPPLEVEIDAAEGSMNPDDVNSPPEMVSKKGFCFRGQAWSWDEYQVGFGNSLSRFVCGGNCRSFVGSDYES